MSQFYIHQSKYFTEDMNDQNNNQIRSRNDLSKFESEDGLRISGIVGATATIRTQRDKYLSGNGLSDTSHGIAPIETRRPKKVGYPRCFA